MYRLNLRKWCRSGVQESDEVRCVEGDKAAVHFLRTEPVESSQCETAEAVAFSHYQSWPTYCAPNFLPAETLIISSPRQEETRGLLITTCHGSLGPEYIARIGLASLS